MAMVRPSLLILEQPPELTKRKLIVDKWVSFGTNFWWGQICIEKNIDAKLAKASRNICFDNMRFIHFVNACQKFGGIKYIVLWVGMVVVFEETSLIGYLIYGAT